MNQNQLQEKLFGANQFATDNATHLLNISEEHPYCGLAHFFSLKNDTANNDLAAKSSLFFKNSYYLQLLLQENDNSNAPQIASTENEAIQQKEISKEPIIIFDNQIAESKVAETAVIENIAIETEVIQPKEIIVPQAVEIEKDATESVLANINTQINTTETELSFEPLHTSDYFASQGIKLSNVVLPNDKLGMQLKSFTSWLKTMKKTHPEKLPTNNILAEVAIQKLAENSNIEAEVYTEPMAEAYVQQGKNIKAIEIYSKLSLMFPEKSAFFANKIENLK
jgi:hypothetical protein